MDLDTRVLKVVDLRRLAVAMNTTTLATNTFSFVNHSLPIHVVVFLVTTHG